MEDLNEILKDFTSKKIIEFIEWAKNCGEDAFYIFDDPDEALERFFIERKKQNNPNVQK
jgi:hypothetical protein